MLTAIPTLNDWATAWLAAMGALLWQSTLLVALAALVAWLLRRCSPVVRYWLWQIVAIKLLLMPFWTFCVPLPTWAGKPVEQSADSQPVASPVDDASPLASRHSSGPAEGPSGITTVQSRSPWEAFAAVTWQAWLLVAWIAVVLWQIVRLLSQRLRLSRLLKQGVAADGKLAELVAELAGQLGLRRVPAAVVVAGDCPLFVCRLWRPRLVVPSRLMASLTRAEFQQVILHELAHVKRHDLLWGWPVEIARIVYFFHPLVYWVSYRLRLERELCCDQVAMIGSGNRPVDYAQTLVHVVSQASEPASVQAAAIAAGLTGSQPPSKQQSQSNDS